MKNTDKVFGWAFFLMLLLQVTFFVAIIWGIYELVFAVADYLGRH